MQEPPIGFTTKVNVVKVIDGDTLDVEITRRIRVRLKDCWCPETRTRDLKEKERGLKAKRHLKDILSLDTGFFSWRSKNHEVVLFIPADKEGDIKEIFSFINIVKNYLLISFSFFRVSSNSLSDFENLLGCAAPRRIGAL